MLTKRPLRYSCLKRPSPPLSSIPVQAKPSCFSATDDPVPAKQCRVIPALLLKRLPEIGSRCRKGDLHFEQLTTQRACIDDLRFRWILPGAVHEQQFLSTAHGRAEDQQTSVGVRV